HIPLLIVVALHKAAHGGFRGRTSIAKKELLVDGFEVVIGVGVELALKLRFGLDLYRFVCCIEIRFVTGEAIDRGVFSLESSEHVVEGAILHHQDDDVFQCVQSSAHCCIWSQCNATSATPQTSYEGITDLL